MVSLVIGSCNYYNNQVKEKAEDRIACHHQYISELRKQSNEGSSSTTSSTQMLGIQQFNERLTCLEEEAEMMKQDFYQTIQERRQLMNEIYHQFQFIRYRDQLTPHNFSKVKRKREGLSEVVWQQQDELNFPSVYFRELKAKASSQIFLN